MNVDLSAILIVLLLGSPLIVLAILLRLKLYRESQHSAEKIQIERLPPKMLDGPAVPLETPRTQRAITTFIWFAGMMILAMFGAAIGLIISFLSNLIHIVFLFPLLMGWSGGRILTDAIQMAKIRKTYQLILMALLMATTIYGTYHYGKYIGLQVQMSFRMFPGFSAATEDVNLKVAKAVVDYALKEETDHSGFVGYMLLRAKEGVSIGRFYSSNRINLGPFFTWLYWILEFGIILWVIISMGKKLIAIPVCEFCGNRYGNERHLGGTTVVNESLLLDLVKQGDFIRLENLLEKNAEVPSVELYLYGCEACNKGQSRLIVRRAFQNSRGMLQFADASQTILQPRDTVQLLNQSRFIGS